MSTGESRLYSRSEHFGTAEDMIRGCDHQCKRHPLTCSQRLCDANDRLKMVESQHESFHVIKDIPSQVPFGINCGEYEYLSSPLSSNIDARTPGITQAHAKTRAPFTESNGGKADCARTSPR